MRKQFFTRLLPGVILIFLALTILNSTPRAELWEEEDPVKQVLQAIREKKYDLAIEFCREQLARQPENYDFNFLLAQALAFSGKWDEASGVLKKLRDLYPANTDLLLFLARIESWKQSYQSAKDLYRQVLDIQPESVEAKLGLGDVAAWQGDYSRAIELYQETLNGDRELSLNDRAEILYRIGRTYLWSGNFRKAREYLSLAVKASPENGEYRRLLDKSVPGLRENFEVRFEQQVESFNDGRRDYLDSRLGFQFPVSSFGPLTVKAARTRRWGQNDYQVEVDFYPQLWPGAYAFINGSYSIEALHFPRYGAQVEIYQTLLKSWEISAGLRRLGFTSTPVWVYLGSLGHYFGSFLGYFRWYYTPGGQGSDFSWTLNLRHYFSRYRYFYAGYGQGSRPFELVTTEDYLVNSARIYTAGLDWLCGQHFRLQLNFTHRKEPVLKRNLLFLSLGYVW